MTIPKPTEEEYRRAITLQLVDYLGLEFKECHVCKGTGDGHTWIPICQTCYGIGRVMFKESDKSDGYVEEFKEHRERWLWGYFNWTDEKDITDAERHTAQDGFDAGATWAEKQHQANKQEIRNEAWAEYEKKRDNGWTEEQQKCFMAGMSVMWRLCKLEHSPLFTYGPDGKPKELDNG